MKNIKKTYIKYGNIQVKQNSKVKYLGCLLDEIMFECLEKLLLLTLSIKLKTNWNFVIIKITGKRHLVCNALIKSPFDYKFFKQYVNWESDLNFSFLFLEYKPQFPHFLCILRIFCNFWIQNSKTYPFLYFLFLEYKPQFAYFLDLPICYSFWF